MSKTKTRADRPEVVYKPVADIEYGKNNLLSVSAFEQGGVDFVSFRRFVKKSDGALQVTKHGMVLEAQDAIPVLERLISALQERQRPYWLVKDGTSYFHYVAAYAFGPKDKAHRFTTRKAAAEEAENVKGKVVVVK